MIFAPIGGLLLWASSTVQEIIIDYSQCNATAPICPETSPIPSSAVTSYFKNKTMESQQPEWCKDYTTVRYGNGTGAIDKNTTACHVQFQIPDRLEPPVLMYYQLTNFYQNHRRYVQSFDQEQLKGTYRDNSSIAGSQCDPLRQEVVGQDENGNDIKKPYYPCGLIANSIFNDTFLAPVLLNPQGTNAANVTYNMTNNDIAWDADADLYGKSPYNFSEVVPPPNWRERYPVYNETFQFPDLSQNEEFQVWMRTAGLPTFSKLALRNDNETMEIGRYEMTVYDCKSIVLAKTDCRIPANATTRRLPCNPLRRDQIDLDLDSNYNGWQKSILGHHLYRGWWPVHPARRIVHCHPAHQAKVSLLTMPVRVESDVS